MDEDLTQLSSQVVHITGETLDVAVLPFVSKRMMETVAGMPVAETGAVDVGRRAEFEKLRERVEEVQMAFRNYITDQVGTTQREIVEHGRRVKVEPSMSILLTC